MSDRLALRALVDEYARAIDLRDSDRFVDVFTEDGYFGIFEPEGDEPHASYRGAEELGTIMALLEPYGPTMHLMANHYVDLHGDIATGVVYALARHLVERNGDTNNLEMTVRYHDEYRRTERGWRIAHRKIIRHWNELLPVMDGHVVF
jgi:ketosteroid isomerase-like protein